MVKETREDRLAAALRENLRRRKTRARGQAGGAVSPDAGVAGAGSTPETNEHGD